MLRRYNGVTTSSFFLKNTHYYQFYSQFLQVLMRSEF
jgi:hypothetical protein